MKYATQSLAKGGEETNLSALANVLRRGACRFSSGMRRQLFRFAGYCGFDRTFASESNAAPWWHGTIRCNRYHRRRIYQGRLGACNLVIIQRGCGRDQF